MRVFAISDVHADFRDNLRLLAQLSTQDYREDALIVAGDVSHDLGILRQTLQSFLDRFRHVFFVPGNHELWIRAGEHPHSVQKFHEVLRLCESLGVRTGPEVIGLGQERVCIVPLFSWYSQPGEGSDTLYREREIKEPEQSVWADDYLVKWPGSAGFRPVRFFLDMNAPRVDARYEVSRISFSHFLPRQDLMFTVSGEAPRPGPDPPRHAFNFSRVAGSTLIEQQIRKLGSRVHVYGHQHRNRCRCHDGTWYVSNCLGYPEERQGQLIRDAGAILKAVWPVQGHLSGATQSSTARFCIT
jgi:predicted phosphodiesterase